MHVGAHGRPDGSIVDTKNGQTWINFQCKSTTNDLDGGFGMQMFAYLAKDKVLHGRKAIDKVVAYVRKPKKLNYREMIELPGLVTGEGVYVYDGRYNPDRLGVLIPGSNEAIP